MCWWTQRDIRPLLEHKEDGKEATTVRYVVEVGTCMSECMFSKGDDGRSAAS